MAKGTLYLLPTGLAADCAAACLPGATIRALHRIDYFIAENPKNARAFLKAAGHPARLQDLSIATLDEHTPASQLPELLRPLENGRDGGVLSDAGCPGVADPGAALVRAAHAAGLRVAPLVGPSALLLALMACGMNGQRFTFHGYLPVDAPARAARLRELERESEAQQATQLFIEAPYRNDVLLAAILQTCAADTLLCLATDLTSDTEAVRTQPIADWKRDQPRLERRPTVFLLYRDSRPRPPRKRRREGRA